MAQSGGVAGVEKLKRSGVQDHRKRGDRRPTANWISAESSESLRKRRKAFSKSVDAESRNCCCKVTLGETGHRFMPEHEQVISAVDLRR
ncbi:hypothetical protein MTO96_039929 [Rhipicephalus appendiculatus]